MNAVVAITLAGVLAQTGGPDVHIPLCDGPCTVPDPIKSDEVFGYLEFYGARALVVRATAYSYTGSRTRTGTVPHWGTVAVDPNVIPLGSRLAIDGYPGTIFVAEDTGGGVRGHHIDVFFPSYAEAVRFGVQTRTVTVLR